MSSGATIPSKTSLSCQWNIPAGVKIDIKPTKAEELFFCNAKYTSNKGKSESQKYNKLKYKKYEPSLFNKHKTEITNVAEIRNALFQSLKLDIKHSCISEMIEGKTHPAKNPAKILSPSLPVLIRNLGSKIPINSIMSSIQLSDDECTLIEGKTRGQSQNPIWHEQRKGRLTASKFYQICTRSNTLLRKPNEDPHRLVSEIMAYESIPTTYAMKHGIAMEPHAKQKLTEILRVSHKKVVTKDTGIFIQKEYPHLGASPESIITCNCCGDFVVEIKCPFSIKNVIPHCQNLPYLIEIDNKTVLKENHPYYFQVQGQMAITNIHKSIFFVYTHHGYFIQNINYNEDLWKNILIKLNYFWSKYILNEILKDILPFKPNQNNTVRPVVDIVKDQCKSVIIPKKNDVMECGICFTPVSDEPKNRSENSIYCDSCNHWFHANCINVTEIEFNNDNAWICEYCKGFDFIVSK